MRKLEAAAWVMVLVACGLVAAGCAPEKTSADVTREKQERVVSEGAAQVGIPAITNFRELKLAKDLYELRDQTGLVTYTYVWSEPASKWTFLCDSIGYPLPYAVQFSAQESVQTWNLRGSGSSGDHQRFGTATLPQAEPNGLFMPDSAEGTWVMCKDPTSDKVLPTYSEPRIGVFQWRLAP